MPQRRQINIDFDRILRTLRKSVERADVFMGVGLNAAEQQPPISHILAPESMFVINFVKQELNDEEKAHLADEFGKWVKTNGLRGLLEGFSVYLLELYVAIYLILGNAGRLGDLAPLTPQKFERLGIADQVVKLARVLPISAENIGIIVSLNKARNCYAHRLGLVGRADVHATTRLLRLEWTAFQVEGLEPNGNVVVGEQMLDYHFRQGADIQLRIVMRSKQFEVGHELLLSKPELKEICLCVKRIGEAIFDAAIALAVREGVLHVRANDRADGPQPAE